MTIMRRFFTFVGFAGLLVLLVCAAGCISTSSAPAARTTAAPASTSGPAVAATTAAATTASGIDTTVSVHFNDYACLDMQKALGVDYLFPDEQYTVWVNTPGSGTITPNLLVLDVNDNTKLAAVKPAWDSVQKTWTYEGIVPLVKLIDITSPQDKTLTIENQGHYYLCIDDRKEVGVSDAVYQVPVKVTKA